METILITYYICVILASLVVLFMKITGDSGFLTIILVTLGKVVPIFTIGFSVVQLFKIFGII